MRQIASRSGRIPCKISLPTSAGSSSSNGISRQIISNMIMAYEYLGYRNITKKQDVSPA